MIQRAISVKGGGGGQIGGGGYCTGYGVGYSINGGWLLRSVKAV